MDAISMKIGLTGGMGCGKSTLAGYFRDFGWSTIDSDSIVRSLLDKDSSVQSSLRARWGRHAFDENGRADRKWIAQRIFSDMSELQWLESLLHPLVRKEWKALIRQAPEKNRMVEVPLLFEKKLESDFDLTVCIYSAPDLVETRMPARGYSRTEYEQRSRRQMPLEEKIERADKVVSNSGSLNFLKLQTTKLIESITVGSDRPPAV